MNEAQARAASQKAKGLVVLVEAWSAPTTEATIKRRQKKAEENAAEHRAIGRVKVCGESIKTEKGDVFRFKVAGSINRDVHTDGIQMTKAGDALLHLVISAPTEYGYTTACQYAGKEGSACERRRPFHAHRAVNLSRVVSWLIAGEEQVQREPMRGC